MAGRSSRRPSGRRRRPARRSRQSWRAPRSNGLDLGRFHRAKWQGANLLVVDQDLEVVEARTLDGHGGQVDDDAGRQVPTVRILGRHLARRQVEHDRILEHRRAVLVAAVDLDLVRPFGLQARGLESQHDDSPERSWVLVADQGVETGAEDVDEAVGRRLRGGGEQRPVEPHGCLTTSPPLRTSRTLSGLASNDRSATGSPGTPMTSPQEPGSSRPTPFMPIVSAATVVAERMQSMGCMPRSFINRNSSPLDPCGPTPVSVPNAIFTPDSIAWRMLALWTSMTTRALAMA